MCIDRAELDGNTVFSSREVAVAASSGEADLAVPRFITIIVVLFGTPACK